MGNEIVLDIETQNTYQEAGARDNRLLKVSLVGIYSYASDSYETFFEDDLPKLWPLLERSGRVIGYNINGFDWPVLNNYYPGELLRLPTLDLMDEIAGSAGFRPRLDDVAKATLGAGKSGNGLQAVEYFRNGDLAKLKAYCLQDVKVTKEIYEFGRQNGWVLVPDRLGQNKKASVSFAPTEAVQKAVNFTLGL